MNKTQKSAIFCLVTFLFCVVVMAYPFISIFILKSWPESFFSRFWSMIAYFVFIAASIIFLRKKQSPAEPDFDERDDLIKKRAVLVSFVSVWILLAAACIIPRFIVGETGAIPVYVLTFINLGIFMVAMLVHSIAVLVQYGWGGKDGQG
ncbi:MAG: hypothetical protein MUO22_07095 [Sedimentisphaerales bacterium]|nr:hypothetical protein [Sedimentisphaerales bacterium]